MGITISAFGWHTPCCILIVKPVTPLLQRCSCLQPMQSLAFQAFLIIICVAIYAILVRNIAVDTDISSAIWTCVGYTVLLCFALFKTGSMAKSVFAAH